MYLEKLGWADLYLGFTVKFFSVFYYSLNMNLHVISQVEIDFIIDVIYKAQLFE